jgi:hypothetical protein
MEPILEEEAGLWTAKQCREEAKRLKRWARQLEMRATIMEIDFRRAYGAKPTPFLKAVPLRILIRN